MLEAKISDAGDITVEDQTVGSLHGFQLIVDPGAEARHGRALRESLTSLLVSAIVSRAEKVAEAGNDAFLLAANGGVRWQGMELARLGAGDGELEPCVRLLADDLLEGHHRDRVQARLDAWVRQYVGTLLKPLLDLRMATGLEGAARSIASRLVENLGILERSRVANDVKGLDQAARAALRGLGVRFGAYHLFVSATVKPKPRELAAQLWVLKHGHLAPDVLFEVPQLAQAGRTSIPVNKNLPKPLYRVLGYYILGERAVRVDILERLADLIRPLIAFRPGVSSGPVPKGAADGNGFVVTTEMTSLIGCGGEDFASILKALGYGVEAMPLAAHEAMLAAANAKIVGTVVAEAAEEESDIGSKPPETPDTLRPAGDPEQVSADGHKVEDPLIASALHEAAEITQTAPVQTIEAEAPSLPQEDEAVALNSDSAGSESVSEPSTEPVSAPLTIEVWRQVRFERRQNQTQDKRGRSASSSSHSRIKQGSVGEAKENGAQDTAPGPQTPDTTNGRRKYSERFKAFDKTRPDTRSRSQSPSMSEDKTPATASRPEEKQPDNKKTRSADRTASGHHQERGRKFNTEQKPRVFSSEPSTSEERIADSPFSKLLELKARLQKSGTE